MRIIKNKKLQESKQLNEGIVDRFIDSFIDSYKQGVERQFIEKTKKANPYLAKALDDCSISLDDLTKELHKIKMNKQ